MPLGMRRWHLLIYKQGVVVISVIGNVVSIFLKFELIRLFPIVTSGDENIHTSQNAMEKRTILKK